MNLQSIAPGLSQDEAGCWCSTTAGPVSYPEGGNQTCFDVEDGSFWFQHRNECIVGLVRRVPPPGTVFDIGGGNGMVAGALQRAGLDVVLLEPGRQGALNARARGVDSVICARMEDVGFEPGTLPAAGLFDVLEHIEDHDGFLRRLHSLLMPGGRLYLTVPAYRVLWSSDDVHAGHFRRYTVRSIRKVLEATGFEIAFASYMFWPLPLPIFLQRTLPSLLGRGGAPRPEQAARDHGRSASLTGKLLDAALDTEAKRLRAGRRLPFGSSCLVAAVRP